jgi:ribosomal protein L37E
MQAPFPSEDFEFIASSAGYLHILCRRCGKETDVEYLGLDPTMPQIKIGCARCGTSITFKIFNLGAAKGFPPDPYRPN